MVPFLFLFVEGAVKYGAPHGDKPYTTRGYCKPSFGFNCQLRCLDPFSDYLPAMLPLTPEIS